MELPALHKIFLSMGKQIERQGNAGYEFEPKECDRIFSLMRTVIGTRFSNYRKEKVPEAQPVASGVNIQVVSNSESVSNQESEISKTINAEMQSLLSDALESEAEWIDQTYSDLGTLGQDVSAVVKRRLGQGYFRKRLEAQFGVECCLSGIRIRDLLIGSHIIPWASLDSNKEKRVDPNNGLLLSVSWDALFDKGLVSFGSDGRPLFKASVDDETLRALGVAKDATLPKSWLSPQRLENLSWHRKHFGFEE